MAHIIAIANQKGGVGKTTTSVNLSSCLAKAGRKTLLIDMDPQGNATSGLGIDKNILPFTVYDLLLDHSQPISQIMLNPLLKNLFLVPSNIQLIGAEFELLSSPEKEFRLQKALSSINDSFDYIIIDSPPSLGLITINILTAASFLLVPVQCEYYALEGLSLLMETIRRVRGSFNPKLHLLGLLITMYDTRTNLSRQVTEDVRKHFGNLVFNTIIPRNVRLSEAPSFGKPIILYDQKSAGAEYYGKFSAELLSKLEKPDVAIPNSKPVPNSQVDNTIGSIIPSQEVSVNVEEKESGIGQGA